MVDRYHNSNPRRRSISHYSGNVRRIIPTYHKQRFLSKNSMSIVARLLYCFLEKQLELSYKGKIMSSDSFKTKSYLNDKVTE
jgi:hypothetical protein